MTLNTSSDPRSKPPTEAPWAGDSYLVPVLPEDPLLCYDYEEILTVGALQVRRALMSHDPHLCLCLCFC